MAVTVAVAVPPTVAIAAGCVVRGASRHQHHGAFFILGGLVHAHGLHLVYYYVTGRSRLTDIDVNLLGMSRVGTKRKGGY